MKGIGGGGKGREEIGTGLKEKGVTQIASPHWPNVGSKSARSALVGKFCRHWSDVGPTSAS